ncbi:MAG: hypothetical protein WC321_02670 [Candidatus Omnitrophota bacterium]|jgi:hypothetical protein
MSKRRNKKRGSRAELMEWLRYRIEFLEMAKEYYARNPILIKSLKKAHIGLIENDIAILKKGLNKIRQNPP